MSERETVIDEALARMDDLHAPMDRVALYSDDQRRAFALGVDAALAAVRSLLRGMLTMETPDDNR